MLVEPKANGFGRCSFVLLRHFLSRQDFASIARSFSCCPGTRSEGGDLGEAEVRIASQTLSLAWPFAPKDEL